MPVVLAGLARRARPHGDVTASLVFPDLSIPGLLLAVIVGGGMLGATTLLARLPQRPDHGCARLKARAARYY
jgi:hypothetical protein